MSKWELVPFKVVSSHLPPCCIYKPAQGGTDFYVVAS
jgi:hypothetical protein